MSFGAAFMPFIALLIVEIFIPVLKFKCIHAITETISIAVPH